MTLNKPFWSPGVRTASLLVSICLLMGSPTLSCADQFVLFDVVFTYTKEDADTSKPSKSHYYVREPALNPERPHDWTAPVDYRNGTVHIRLEVIEKPAGTEPTTWTLCYIPNRGQKNGYGCTGTGIYHEEGVYERDVSMKSFWEHDSIIWSEGIRRMDLVIKDDSGGRGHAHRRADWQKFFPTKVRITMIQVSAGSTYDPALLPGPPAATAHGREPTNRPTDRVVPTVDDTGRQTIDFAPVDDFLKLPAGMELGPCSAVDVDSQGNIYVLQRETPPVLCFDGSGQFLFSWGDRLIGHAPDLRGAHGLRVDPADNVWIADRARHLVRKFDRNGRLLLTLGTEDRAGTGEQQFDRPADVAFGPAGEIYVADGYGNSRVMKFDQTGKFLTTWGRAGSGPGEFNLPHTMAVGPDKRVYVGDRFNHRVQIFDSQGVLQQTWTGFTPCGMAFDDSGTLFVVDGVSKVLQIGVQGEVVKSWGAEPEELGLTPGQRSVPPIENPGGYRFVPHLMAVDARGNLYLADVADRMLFKLNRKRQGD